MLRRVLALHTVFCLLATFFTLSTPPTLVCRMTGEPMPPVVATAENEGSCCAVAPKVRGDGRTEYELTSPGCCDLVITAGADHPPATVSSADLSTAVALIPEVTSLVGPALHEVSLRPALWREAAPRAPPPRACSPRAPPFFS